MVKSSSGVGVAIAILSIVIVVLLLGGAVLGLRFLRKSRLASVQPHIMKENLPMLHTDDLSSPLVSPREQFAISSMENSPREEISLDLNKLKESMDDLDAGDQ